MDSGSQITCVSKSFYASRLSHRELHPLCDLGVRGAGGHNIPYLGYIQVNITPAGNDAGTKRTVGTLALILPDTLANERVPLLIGTNTTLLQTLLHDCRQRAGRNFTQKLKVSNNWAQAYKLAATLDRCGPDGLLGQVKLREGKVIPGYGRVVMDCGC